MAKANDYFVPGDTLISNVFSMVQPTNLGRRNGKVGQINFYVKQI